MTEQEPLSAQAQRGLIEGAIKGLTALRDEFDGVQAATVGRKDLEASMASIKVAHDAALAERQREQKAFEAERAKHDTERKKLAEELSDLRADHCRRGAPQGRRGRDRQLQGAARPHPRFDQQPSTAAERRLMRGDLSFLLTSDWPIEGGRFVIPRGTILSTDLAAGVANFVWQGMVLPEPLPIDVQAQDQESADQLVKWYPGQLERLLAVAPAVIRKPG
jgi:hypothetical protein